MTNDQNHQQLLREIFFPFAANAAKQAQLRGGRFAHYTTADTAIQILRNRRIWMRSTLVMNDYSEVNHGLGCLVKAYRSPSGEAFDQAIDRIFPEISNEIKIVFDSWIPNFQQNTFVACLSEHDGADDKYGRLSMWRAYAANSGVAIILRGDVCFRPSDALGAYTSPIAYVDDDGLKEQLKLLAHNIERNAEFIAALGRERTKGAVFSILRYAAICTKHPAFKEEREWRVIANPRLTPVPRLDQTIEVIGRVPQEVLKIPLADYPDEGLVGLEPNKFIDRILIGPSEHPEVVRRALVIELAAAGVDGSDEKVQITGIPLRENQR